MEGLADIYARSRNDIRIPLLVRYVDQRTCHARTLHQIAPPGFLSAMYVIAHHLQAIMCQLHENATSFTPK